PGLAAVLRSEDAPLGVRTKDVPLRRYVDEVGVVGVDADPRDLPRILEADVLPAAAAVRRLVDPVPVRDVAADRLLSGPHVNDVRVRLGDGDGPDRARLEVLVGEHLPVGSAVGRLPDA